MAASDPGPMSFWQWALLFRANGCGPITAHLRAWRMRKLGRIAYAYPRHALDRL
ncbi:hypothetical protein [Mameliella sediminis]|uniref:hypothetical protein n=1 Tax=Mameliella sediminis TaxID=2836866 RepID=UPI001C489424|nr:hypothetical protein [Mameliella sediminis]MBV7394563.1 hypothetical protein [Mameliella sediminis]